MLCHAPQPPGVGWLWLERDSGGLSCQYEVRITWTLRLCNYLEQYSERKRLVKRATQNKQRTEKTEEVPTFVNDRGEKMIDGKKENLRTQKKQVNITTAVFYFF